MGTQILGKDIDAEDDVAEYLAPVRRGLEAIHFMNKIPGKVAKNYAPGKPNGVFVGSPVLIGAQSVRTKSLSTYVQTQVREARAMTIFSVVRTQDTLADNATRPMFYGTFRSLPADGTTADTTFGISLFAASATQYSAGAGRGNSLADHTSGPATLTVAPGSWALMIHRTGVGASEDTIVRNETAGTQAQNASSALPRYPSLGLLRIGSGYTQFAGHADMAFFQAHSVALTTDEIATVVADVRTHMARRGVTI